MMLFPKFVYLVKKLHQMTDADLLSGKVEVKHPCLQSGYNEEYICSHCASALQEGGSPPAEGNKWEWSSQSPAMDCELQPCALPNHLPHPYGNFYAMSGFFVVYRFFNLTPALDDALFREGPQEGLHIPDSFVAIGSGSITWTLGVALLEAGKTVPTTMVFQSYERLKMKIHPIILFGILFLFNYRFTSVCDMLEMVHRHSAGHTYPFSGIIVLLVRLS
ncbi:hypothetical protein Leryth_007953 [Lithospermum erythrorhizon]|nr:hypothetical protein Leryth_007953 [Lithospermum erythrorhizon]